MEDAGIRKPGVLKQEVDMKRNAGQAVVRLLLLAGGLLWSVTCVAQEAKNLFLNGDFEKWGAGRYGQPQGWDKWHFWRPAGENATPQISRETKDAHQGRKSLRFTTKFHDHYLGRTIQLKRNTEYVFSCWYQAKGGHFAISADDPEGKEPRQLFIERCGANANWERVTAVFKTRKSGKARFYFQSNSKPFDEGGEIQILLDDISVKNAGPLPAQGVIGN